MLPSFSQLYFSYSLPPLSLSLSLSHTHKHTYTYRDLLLLHYHQECCIATFNVQFQKMMVKNISIIRSKISLRPLFVLKASRLRSQKSTIYFTDIVYWNFFFFSSVRVWFHRIMMISKCKYQGHMFCPGYDIHSSAWRRARRNDRRKSFDFA